MDHISKVLQTIKPEQVKQGLQLSKIGGLVGPETELEVALSGVKLKNASVSDLDRLFRRCMIKVGIRAANLPTTEETRILYDHIIKNYSGHTIEEIELAFEMAITGKLDVDANPYENFSCTYLSKIINAYRIWASQAHIHMDIRKNEIHVAIDKIDWRGLIQKDYELFLNERHNFQLWPAEYYEQLVADGFIYPFFYKELMDECRRELCAEVQLKITVEKNPLKAELEEYNATQDLEMRLIEYRSGKRDIEVVLMAKQKGVLFLFSEAKTKGYKQLYVQQ